MKMMMRKMEKKKKKKMANRLKDLRKITLVLKRI